MLYEINHDNKSKLWCGPAAIAAVTGQPTSVIHRMLKLERLGRTHADSARIMGVYPQELHSVMRRLGYLPEKILSPRGKVTLGQFATSQREVFAQTPMIVELATHYVVLMGRRFVDNWTKTPVFITSAPHRKRLVKSGYTWVKVSEPSIPPEALPKKRSNAGARARYLADKHGIEIERENMGSGPAWWVTCPALEHDDPHEGDHFATSMDEVLQMVEDYVECLTTGYLEAVTALPEPTAPDCPETTTEAVRFALQQHGDDTEMGIACTLSLIYGRDITERQVRGSAMRLITSGIARHYRGKLQLLAPKELQ